LKLANHPQPGGTRGVFHLLKLRDIPLHGCNKGITHKISQEWHYFNTSTGIKNFTNGSHSTVTLIRLIEFKAAVSNRKKSVVAASTGQEEKYNWDPIRTGNHSAFSKGGSIQFFNEFCSLEIKSKCPDFFCGSGNKLNAVPIIFAGQLQNFITQEIAGFLSAKHKHK
jgi:hypothetical protein